jgi:hypothetical protein
MQIELNVTQADYLRCVLGKALEHNRDHIDWLQSEEATDEEDKPLQVAECERSIDLASTLLGLWTVIAVKRFPGHSARSGSARISSFRRTSTNDRPTIRQRPRPCTGAEIRRDEDVARLESYPHRLIREEPKMRDEPNTATAEEHQPAETVAAKAATAKKPIKRKAAAKPAAKSKESGKPAKKAKVKVKLRDGLRVGSAGGLLVDTVCRKQGATHA